MLLLRIHDSSSSVVYVVTSVDQRYIIRSIGTFFLHMLYRSIEASGARSMLRLQHAGISEACIL